MIDSDEAFFVGDVDAAAGCSSMAKVSGAVRY